MPATITPERPDTPDATALIAELETYLEPLYPRESRHGYSVEKLIAEGVAFFSSEMAAFPLAVVASSCLAPSMERSSGCMCVPSVAAKGSPRSMMNHLAEYAQSHGVGTLRLETGIHQHAAIALYEQMGFQQIPPFGDYKYDPLSRCYEKRIA